MNTKHRINHRINAIKLRVISDSGEQLGILSRYEALKKAEEAGLDLVEISPNAQPPVVKIMDYGKFLYQQQKKEKEGKKHQVIIKIKEVKLRPNIDDHDLETKLSQARRFIEDGCKVKITVQLRGREVVHKELGEQVIFRFCDQLKDIATIESKNPYDKTLRSMITVLTPSLGVKRAKQKLGDSENAKNEDQESGS